jgi:hypothetical protein
MQTLFYCCQQGQDSDGCQVGAPSSLTLSETIYRKQNADRPQTSLVDSKVLNRSSFNCNFFIFMCVYDSASKCVLI